MFTLPTECEWPTFEAGGAGSARLVCVEQIVLTGGQLLLLSFTTSSSEGGNNGPKDTNHQIILPNVLVLVPF